MRTKYSPGYTEYAQLYADFISLANSTSRKYQYLHNKFTQQNFIPLIRNKLATETNVDERNKLTEMEKIHIDRWKRLETVINAISKNEYAIGWFANQKVSIERCFFQMIPS